jgi:transcription antitermination factor NusG
MTDRWYCVNTHFHQERIAVAQLARQSFVTFFPVELIINNKGDEVSRALFPGYLFVQFNKGAQRWRAIYSTIGVKRLLSDSPENPTAIPHEVMERLMQMQSDGMFNRIPSTIREGSAVRMTAGAFKGFEGVVTATSARRVQILLKILGSASRVSADMKDMVSLS